MSHVILTGTIEKEPTVSEDQSIWLTLRTRTYGPGGEESTDIPCVGIGQVAEEMVTLPRGARIGVTGDLRVRHRPQGGAPELIVRVRCVYPGSVRDSESNYPALMAEPRLWAKIEIRRTDGTWLRISVHRPFPLETLVQVFLAAA